MLKKLIFFVYFTFVLFYNINLQGQAVLTSASGILTDSSGQIWSNAIITASLVAPFGNPNPTINNGVPTEGPQTTIADAAGNFTLLLDDNTVVRPTGTTWKITVCPNASVAVCSTSVQVIFGATQNIGASVSNDLTVPKVAAAPTIFRAYLDSEVTGGQGALYWRVTDNTLRGFNGLAWIPIGSSGGGGTPNPPWSSLSSPTTNLGLGMNNFSTTFNMGTNTGVTGSAFQITDSTTNIGTNYLFQIITGTTSTAKPFSACVQGTSNCIEFNSNAILQALGTAGITATQVINNTVGIGSIQLGSNGGGTISAVNTIKLTGNSNAAYISENGGTLSKVLLGGQLDCGTSVLQTTSTSGTPTCLNILGGGNTFTGSNTFSIVQKFTGIRLGYLQQVFGSNTDTSGSLAFTGGTTSASYTFSTSLTHPPFCTYAPTFNPTTTSIWFSTINSTTLQFSSSANLTGSVDYICVTTADF